MSSRLGGDRVIRVIIVVGYVQLVSMDFGQASCLLSLDMRSFVENIVHFDR